MTIGALARAAGVGVDTVRFYEREGLLPQPARRASGYRQYTAATVQRLRFIRRAKELGFSLDEVAQLLKLDDGTHCHEAAELAALRLADVRARLADLKRMEKALSQLVVACNTHHGQVSCPLIAALH